MKDNLKTIDKVEVLNYTYNVSVEGRIQYRFNDFHKAYMKAIYSSIDYPDDLVIMKRYKMFNIKDAMQEDKNFIYKFRGGKFVNE